MQPPTLRGVLESDVLEHARSAAVFAARHAHKTIGGCQDIPDADTEIHYRTNNRDTLMVVVTVKTTDASGAAIRAMLAASTVAIVLAQVYGPLDPQLITQELRLEHQPSAAQGGVGPSAHRARGRAGRVSQMGWAAPQPAAAPTQDWSQVGRAASAAQPAAKKPEPIGTVASYTAAIRRRRRRTRLH